MEIPNLPLLALACVLLVPRSADAGESTFQDCYARWDKTSLTVGNDQFERRWTTGSDGLVAASFLMKHPRFEWLAGNSPPPDTATRLEISATPARKTTVGAEGLRVDVGIPDAGSRVFWVFPGLAGVIAESTGTASATPDTPNTPATGIEKDPARPNPGQAGTGDDTLRLQPRHLRVIETTLRDQTDHHSELVHSREWLLWMNESPIDIRGCVLAVENPLDGSGIAFLKLAPLPHARQDPQAIDFRIRPGQRAVSSFFHGHPVASVAYHGGQAGRTRALHAVQRRLRQHVPGRDGMFLSNTWGDRSRDARINETFLLKEVEAGAKLGVDVVQIDDGWQKGRSANSADARGKGVWNGYWAADPEFWNPDPARFPNGLEPVVAAARRHGMKFGLWFGPDSSNEAANWQKDADHLLSLHRTLGIDYFKIDSMKTLSATSLNRQRAMFDRMLAGSQGAMTFDLDVTAEIRPGYFGLPDIGPIFLQNRYTDWGSYWPHLTLRSLWSLSHTVDPLRLRIEVPNPTRNPGKYGNDPLAPARYRADTVFATAMMANPLAWFEVSNLPPAAAAEMQPLVATWKKERERMHGGTILPVGSTPDGVAWTGFVTADADGRGGYALLFRELNDSPHHVFDLPFIQDPGKVTILGGRGAAGITNGRLAVTIMDELDFLWVRID